MFSLLFLLTLSTSAPQVELSRAPNDSVRIYGSCWDMSTGIDLKARVIATVDERNVVVGESDENGLFDIPISVSTSDLTFESKGYRTITTPVHFLGETKKEDRFRIYFKMIALDSQQVARPLNGLSKGKKVLEQADDIPQSHFQVRDAYLGKALTAKICLTFKRTGRTYCLDTDSTSAPTASFVGELDKIDLKVTSAGFQDYEGSLKSENTGTGEVIYQIKLQKVVLPIVSMTFNAPDSLPIEYRSKGSGSAWLPYHKGSPWKEIMFENALLGEQTLNAVHTGSNTTLSSERYTIKPGLNFKSIHVSGPESMKEIVMPVNNIVNAFQNRTLHFDQSSYEMRQETKLTLDSISEFLRSQRDAKARITGHSDNVGKRDLNLMLSEHRARVVAHYLKKKGVQPQQISLTYKGPDAPIAPNDTEENKVKNRRVEIQVGKL